MVQSLLSLWYPSPVLDQSLSSPDRRRRRSLECDILHRLKYDKILPARWPADRSLTTLPLGYQ
jgi:hypothetical protein